MNGPDLSFQKPVLGKFELRLLRIHNNEMQIDKKIIHDCGVEKKTW
jgi:hypothetical protein